MFEAKSTPAPGTGAVNILASGGHAIEAAQHAANGMLDDLVKSGAHLRDQAAPLIDRASDQAGALWSSSVEGVRHTSEQLSDAALRARRDSINYVKNEPVKALLIAAATGAVLMALVSMLSHAQRRD